MQQGGDPTPSCGSAMMHWPTANAWTGCPEQLAPLVSAISVSISASSVVSSALQSSPSPGHRSYHRSRPQLCILSWASLCLRITTCGGGGGFQKEGFKREPVNILLSSHLQTIDPHFLVGSRICRKEASSVTDGNYKEPLVYLLSTPQKRYYNLSPMANN